VLYIEEIKIIKTNKNN